MAVFSTKLIFDPRFPPAVRLFSELTRGVSFNFDYPKPNAWSQVTPWEQASFPDFLLEASHPDHHHPRTTTSRTTQKYKSYNFLWEQKIPVSLLSLTKETWGDAWGEGAVGAVQQVWHGDGDHQDWKVRKTETVKFADFHGCCLLWSCHFIITVIAEILERKILRWFQWKM